MKQHLLHITNGSMLTEYLEILNFQGHFLTWHEMLCEGPTVKIIDSTDFISTRKHFIKESYDLEYDEIQLKTLFETLNNLKNYTEIILWFEYDLFCHINLIAVISLLKQKQVRLPIYLVCSGRVEGHKDLKSLTQLSEKELINHYNTRIELSVDDIALAQKAWRIYCGNDHNLLKELITRPSNFKYMGTCLKAHLKRFPDSRNGLNSLEYNILSLIKKHEIKSKHHLLGYALHYQGYYGFGDLQLKAIINRLTPLFNETEDRISLNDQGIQVLDYKENFNLETKNHPVYGGLNRNSFRFNEIENKLIALAKCQ